MNEKVSMLSDVRCLLCQAKVAPNYYDLEDSLELIRELSERLKEMNDEQWKRYTRVD